MENHSPKNWYDVWMNFDASFRAPSSTVDPSCIWSPPLPSLCKCQIPLRTHYLRYHTDYPAQIKNSDTQIKQFWTIKKGKQTFSLKRALTLLCSIGKPLQQIRKRIVELLFVFTINHFSWLFFFHFKNVLILWTSSNQFCNQSSIRLEKSWIFFDYPLANSHRTKRLLNFVLGIKVL